MRYVKLSEQQIAMEIVNVPLWSRRGAEIWRRYQFDSFGHCMLFVNRVADAAEASDHHPDIDIRYDKVTLALTTHDSGGLTTKDFELARLADAIAAQLSDAKWPDGCGGAISIRRSSVNWLR